MISTNPESVKKMMPCFLVLFFIIGGIVVITWDVFLIPYIIGCIFLLWLSIYLAYRNESFTTHAFCGLAAFVGALVFLGMLLVNTIVSKKTEGVLWVSLLTLAPAALTILGCVWVCSIKSKETVFEVLNGRVQSNPSKVNASYSGLIGGISVVVSGIFLKVVGQDDAGLILVVFMAVLLISSLHYYRDVIRGLRLLRMKESQEGIKYTFMNIEEIREMRAASWLGRWLARRVR